MKIVYLPPIAYDNLKQRPQYLAEELAKKHEVLYVDPTVSMMKYLLKGGERPGGRQYDTESGLHVVRLNGMLSLHRSLEAIWRGVCIPERIQLKKYLRTADAVWVGYAPWYDLIRDFPGTVIYDKMDEDAGITHNQLMRRLITRSEPALIARADHIFVTARQFQRKISEQGKQPVLVPNAVNREQGLRQIQVAPRHQDGTRIFGYVGMISHWFDMDAVLTILQENPCNHVVLVGPAEIPVVQHERLRFVGRVPKEEVGKWIASFDICLYPFQHTALLDTIDPVKIYEYLAANKPVLAARSIETEKFGARVINYGNRAELKEILQIQTFSAPFENEEARERFIMENEWETRGMIIERELEHGYPGT